MGGYCTSRRARSILLFVSIYPEFAEIFQDYLHVSSIQSEQTTWMSQEVSKWLVNGL